MAPHSPKATMGITPLSLDVRDLPTSPQTGQVHGIRPCPGRNPRLDHARVVQVSSCQRHASQGIGRGSRGVGRGSSSRRSLSLACHPSRSTHTPCPAEYDESVPSFHARCAGLGKPVEGKPVERRRGGLPALLQVKNPRIVNVHSAFISDGYRCTDR